MNRIILAPILIALLSLFPTAVPTSHGQLVGQICLADPSSTGCPASPPAFTGAPGTQINVAVFIQGSDALLGFDMILTADNNILKPAGADLTGTILPGSLTVLAECIGGVAVVGNCIAPASGNVTTLEVAAIGSGGLTTSPVSGLLFTAIYNITGSTSSTSLDYQTGCTANIEPSSVSGTTICVSIANGTATPVPETVQAASFTNNAPDFSLAASPNNLVMGRGTSTTSTITATPINGFTGTANLSVSIAPTVKKGPTATLASPSLTVTSGPASELLTINVPKGGTLGTYTITITGTSGSITTTTTITVTLTK